MPLRPAARTLLILVICLVAALAAQASPSQAGLTGAEKRLLHVMNRARVNHGVPRLRISSTLESGAHSWARYLRIHDSFYHGRIASGTSENIGWITCRRGWARTLVRWWLNSYYHRINLLDRSARRVGVGLAKGRWSGYGCVRMAVTRFR